MRRRFVDGAAALSARAGLRPTDDILNDITVRLFGASNPCRRVNNGVPGPLEAQRRHARRRMGLMAHDMGASDLASFGAVMYSTNETYEYLPPTSKHTRPQPYSPLMPFTANMSVPTYTSGMLSPPPPPPMAAEEYDIEEVAAAELGSLPAAAQATAHEPATLGDLKQSSETAVSALDVFQPAEAERSSIFTEAEKASGQAILRFGRPHDADASYKPPPVVAAQVARTAVSQSSRQHKSRPRRKFEGQAVLRFSRLESFSTDYQQDLAVLSSSRHSGFTESQRHDGEAVFTNQPRIRFAEAKRKDSFVRLPLAWQSDFTMDDQLAARAAHVLTKAEQSAGEEEAVGFIEELQRAYIPAIASTIPTDTPSGLFPYHLIADTPDTPRSLSRRPVAGTQRELLLEKWFKEDVNDAAATDDDLEPGTISDADLNYSPHAFSSAETREESRGRILVSEGLESLRDARTIANVDEASEQKRTQHSCDATISGRPLWSHKSNITKEDAVSLLKDTRVFSMKERVTQLTEGFPLNFKNDDFRHAITGTLLEANRTGSLADDELYIAMKDILTAVVEQSSEVRRLNHAAHRVWTELAAHYNGRPQSNFHAASWNLLYLSKCSNTVAESVSDRSVGQWAQQSISVAVNAMLHACETVAGEPCTRIQRKEFVRNASVVLRAWRDTGLQEELTEKIMHATRHVSNSKGAAMVCFWLRCLRSSGAFSRSQVDGALMSNLAIYRRVAQDFSSYQLRDYLLGLSTSDLSVALIAGWADGPYDDNNAGLHDTMINEINKLHAGTSAVNVRELLSECISDTQHIEVLRSELSANRFETQALQLEAAKTYYRALCDASPTAQNAAFQREMLRLLMQLDKPRLALRLLCLSSAVSIDEVHGLGEYIRSTWPDLCELIRLIRTTSLLKSSHAVRVQNRLQQRPARQLAPHIVDLISRLGVHAAVSKHYNARTTWDRVEQCYRWLVEHGAKFNFNATAAQQRSKAFVHAGCLNAATRGARVPNSRMRYILDKVMVSETFETTLQIKLLMIDARAKNSHSASIESRCGSALSQGPRFRFVDRQQRTRETVNRPGSLADMQAQTRRNVNPFRKEKWQPQRRHRAAKGHLSRLQRTT